MIPLFFFLFGTIIGSFLNVCITRIPEGLSIISPRSRCPRCLHPIKPYDNVPVIGWLVLRGRCRDCSLPISPMYPVVELLTGLFFLLTYFTFGITLSTLKFLCFGSLLIILIATDLRDRLLPDNVNWFGFALGLAFATRIRPDRIAELAFSHARSSPVLSGVLSSLVGAAFGSFFLWAAAFLYRVIRKQEGMGMGDVKMMAMVGTFLGLRGTFLTIFFGTLLGSVVGFLLVLALYLAGWRQNIAERAARRGLGRLWRLRWTLAARYQLPLGSFLGLAAFIVVYALPHLVDLGVHYAAAFTP